MAQGYYSMIAREVDAFSKNAKAKLKRARGAFSQFNVFGQAAKRIAGATGTSRSGAPLPNKGRPTR